MKILIIRHGDPDYSIDSLTEKGFREAKLLSERLNKIHIDAFYSSPLGRAKDTAKPTMDLKNASYTVLDWLKEFSGYVKSPWSGKDRIAWDLPPSYWTGNKNFLDSEKFLADDLIKNGTVIDVLNETHKGIYELLKKHGVTKCGLKYILNEKAAEKEETIALFCHCGMGLAIISYLTGLPLIISWHNLFLPTSSVTTLITETDREGASHFKCIQIGDTSHLYAGGEEVSKSGLYPDFYK